MTTVETNLQGQLLDLFLFLGASWILHLLVALSVLSLAISLERVWHFVRRRADVNAMQRALDAKLRAGDVAGARALLTGSRSEVAIVALAGLDNLERGAAAAEEMIAAATQSAKLSMERGLTFLGTLGNNAPFIGLFGTVLGIIRAFRDLSLNSANGSTAVMAGIAESLIATAVGLLVALPAVAIFNTFQKVIRSRLAGSDAVAHVVLAYAKAERS